MRSHARLAAASLAVAGIVFGVFGVAPAWAHPSPIGCETTASNSLSLDVARDSAILRNGDVIRYTVTTANNSGAAGTICDVDGVTVTLQLPSPDGRPTGELRTLQVGGSYPAGTGTAVLGVVEWTVNLLPGVTSATVLAHATGTLHDIVGDDLVDITKTLGTRVVPPTLTLTHTVTPETGPAPLPVTHTYTLTNDSGTDTPVFSPAVVDDRCRTVVAVRGDTNNNSLLDVGESWTYICTETIPNPGTTTTTATGTGTITTTSTPISSNPASATVTVTPPPVTPQQQTPPRPVDGTPDTPGGDDEDDSGADENGGPSQPTRAQILGRRLPGANSRRARNPAPCLSVPRSLRVRAGERTTIRVRVQRSGGRPAVRRLVRIVGPGVNARRITGTEGFATFTIRPRRSGTLVIQTDRCAGADRITVRGARRTESGRVPRVTG